MTTVIGTAISACDNAYRPLKGERNSCAVAGANRGLGPDAEAPALCASTSVRTRAASSRALAAVLGRPAG